MHDIVHYSCLLVAHLTETPPPENPWLIEHQTYFQLMWSPVYLWRGHYIDHFIITVMDFNGGTVVYKTINVNQNLRDRYIESYNHSLKFNNTCSEVSFDIRAVNCDGILNGSYQVRGMSRLGWYPLIFLTILNNSCKNYATITTDTKEFAMFIPPLNSMVLFDANATPILIIQVEVSQSIINQSLSLIIIIIFI